MKIVTSVQEITDLVSQWKKEGACIGLVPTMGWFHEGHLALMRLARKKADKVIVSLFVNPMQFGPSEDLESYPRDIERDYKLASETGADILFSPPVEDIYPGGYQTTISVKELSVGLCGGSRPGHFDGVTTVVAKLFNMTQPDIACFGEKDYQQLAVIRRMVKDLNYNLEIIGHPIVREEDGVAMSSRNTYLTNEEREHATCLYRSILHAQQRATHDSTNLTSETLIKDITNIIESTPGCVVDYVSIFDKDSLLPVSSIQRGAVLALAVVINSRIRLIDNTSLLV